MLLVSCLGSQTGGGLVQVDPSSGDLVVLDRMGTTGLDVDESGSRLARTLWDPASADHFELVVYDAKGAQRWLRVDGAGDPHDVCWTGDEVAVAVSSVNRIVWVGADGRITREWGHGAREDSWHVNGIKVDSEGSYASAFGRFDGQRAWLAQLGRGTGIVFDPDSGRDLLSGLDAPHSARRLGDRWLVGNSFTGELLLMRSPATVERRLDLGGWVRGIAVTDGRIWAAASAYRVGEHETGPPGRARLFEVALDSFEVVRSIELPFQEVHDVVEVSPQLLAGVRTGFGVSPDRVADSERRAWIEQTGVDPRDMSLQTVPLAANEFRIEVEPDLSELVLRPGQEVRITGRVRNLAPVPLSSRAPFPVHLAGRWRDGADQLVVQPEPPRMRVPGILLPGTGGAVAWRVTAPDDHGTYVLALTAVQEHVAWFDEVDISNRGLVRVDVGEQPAGNRRDPSG